MIDDSMGALPGRHLMEIASLPKRWVRRCVATLLLAGALLPARALALSAVALPESVKPVDEAAKGGVIDPRTAVITRRVLKAAESAAPLEFEVTLKMRNFSELQARVARGERISAQEMADRYDPLASDYDAVAAWVANEGLTITRRDGHHMSVFARGKISQIGQALGVSFARVSVGGEEYTSAISAPSVPAALRPALLGINGLQPHIRAHKHILRRQATPDALSGTASYLPKQIAQAYNATALYNTDIEGSGQAIAIVIDTFPATSDLEAFWGDAGVSQSIGNIQFIQAVSGTLPAPSGEETLDVEWSSAMAPEAHVRVYAATDLASADIDQAYEQVYEDATNHPGLGIHQMSMSFGYGESYVTSSQVQTDDQYFVKLAAAGVTIFVSSGDDGSTPGSGGTGDETGPVQVDAPADDPNVTAVGGTTLVLNNSNNETSEVVWNENGGASGGGVSKYFTRPAWQTGTGSVSGTQREVPDVAGAADPNYGGVIVEGGVEQTVGGTSWSSPTWAGFCALLNEARADAGQGTLGLLGPQLYPLLNGTNYPTTYQANFRDITSGNNATSASGGKYNATAGYDLCTGLGAPHLQTLAQTLIGSTAALVGIQNPATEQQVIPGQSATFTVSVQGVTATYQWQRMPVGTATWSNLSDGGAYTGSAGPALTIAGATTAMSGDQFQCLVGIGSSTVTTSPPSVLVVDTPVAISTLAGRVGTTGLANGNGTAAEFNYPSGVAVDGSGTVYVADYGNNQVRRVTAAGAVSTPYGSINGFAGSTNGSGNSALFTSPNGVALDGSGNLYVADTGNNLIRKITSGVASTLAGEGGEFNSPEGVAVDGAGNVYVADTGNDVIWEVTSNGSLSILAGQNGVSGYADGNATTKALFNGPTGVAVDSQGNVYVADFGNSVVRKIASGTVTTVAGQAQVSGYQDGLAANSLFNAPIGVAVDAAGNLYIADCQVPALGSNAAGNDLLRKLTPAGVVSTLAGDAGAAGSTNGTGTTARFYSAQAAAVSASGQVYLADTYNQSIRTGTANSSVTVPSTRGISLSGDLAFGSVAVGLSASNTLTISNTGTATLTVTNIAYPSGFAGNWASGTITAGGSQLVTVTFTPVHAIGYSGNISVTSNATTGSGTIAVSGSGVTSTPEPTVVTSPATDIGAASATLNGEVNPEGSETTVYFQYGLTGTYGSVTSGTSAGISSASVPFTAAISGLLPLTEYHYQAVASNAGGTVTGSDQTFTTLGFTSASLAETGDAAPGVAGGEYASLGNPSINSVDYVAFQATLAENSAAGVTAVNNSGIWAADASGTRYLVASTGTAAPGTSANFLALSNPVYNDSEAVAFIGRLKTGGGAATAASATGVWSTSGGSLALVAREGDQAPGFPTGVKFKTFSGLALPDSGGVLLLATVTGGHAGIWAGNSAADLQLIVKEGGVVNGKTIGKLAFLPTLPYVDGQTRSFSQSTGALVVHATFSDKSTGIVELAGTSSQVIAQSQTAAPGIANGLWAAFGNPAMNGTGNVAFEGTLVTGIGGIAALNKSGIWADDSTGTLQLIARTGDPAAGTSAAFQTLGDPVYNDNDAVAFRGTLKVSSGVAAPSNASGIWANNGGSLALVARQGSPAAGCQGGTFKLFNALALPDQGGVIFMATLNNSGAAGINASNNAGIWAVDTGGNVQLIVRKGSVMNGKIITGLSFMPVLAQVGGQSRNFSAGTGDLVYQATFSDKTSAIFVVSFQ